MNNRLRLSEDAIHKGKIEKVTFVEKERVLREQIQDLEE